jgi:hypothetical protein
MPEITLDILNNLEDKIGIKEITSENEFNDVIGKKKIILYLLVDWSGPERMSRYAVYQSLNDLKIIDIEIFKIDCSDQSKLYVHHWMNNQSDKLRNIYLGGNGETFLIENGKVTDFMKHPFNVGIEKTKETLQKWI